MIHLPEGIQSSLDQLHGEMDTIELAYDWLNYSDSDSYQSIPWMKRRVNSIHDDLREVYKQYLSANPNASYEVGAAVLTEFNNITNKFNKIGEKVGMLSE